MAKSPASKNENKVRVNIVLSSEILEKIDKYADEMSISRSSAISVLCSLQFKQEETMNAAKEMMTVLNNPIILEQLNRNKDI